MEPVNERPFHTAWIEQYLSGELQGAELDQFMHRLHTDVAFRQEVALQRSIIAQAREVGRQELQKQLKSLHRQMGFAQEKQKRLPVSWYAVAAAILLLLAASVVFYFSYQPSGESQPVAKINKPVLTKKSVVIRFGVTGLPPAIGFSGTQTDSTITILMYPAQSAAYRFDDTLRLYGSFEPSQLSLQYNQAEEQYTLFIDSLAYSLQRYRPRQTLQPIP
jgi:hypothetical protein